MTPVHALVAYSSPGPAHGMATMLAHVAESAGAEVRLRHVAEFTPCEDSDLSGAWADVAWADVVLWGAPSRHANVAGQLKHILEMLGPRWATRRLSEKVYAGFTASHLVTESSMQHEELAAFERMAERCVSIARRQKAA